MITIITHTPSDYSGSIHDKMIESGLIRIETEFIHNEDFSKGTFGKTQYIFIDKIIKSVAEYRAIVFNWK